jgi:hypothetical protein
MYVCEKCKTCLHTGGRLSCPWGHLGDDRAWKEAAKALRGLSTGQCNYIETTKPAGRTRAKAGGRQATRFEGDIDTWRTLGTPDGFAIPLYVNLLSKKITNLYHVKLSLYRTHFSLLLGKKSEGSSVCGPIGREDRESSLLEENKGCDVLEAPSQRIRLQKRIKITFGTIGEGIDLAEDIWNKQEHLFASQT